MATLSRFKCTIPYCQYIFANGKQAAFIGGIYDTGVASEIAELTAACEAGSPHFYIDPSDNSVSTDRVDPLELIRQRAVADYLAQQAAIAEAASQETTSEAAPVTPASTASLLQALIVPASGS